MKYEDMAKKIATEAHRGQKRKGGEDYISHVSAVVEHLRAEYYSIMPREAYLHGPWGMSDVRDCVIAAAWLHDVVEDTMYSIRDLEDEGFPLMVTGIVDTLTKRTNESYFDYVMRIDQASGAFRAGAVAIKLSDLWHNIHDREDPAAAPVKYRFAEHWLSHTHGVSFTGADKTTGGQVPSLSNGKTSPEIDMDLIHEAINAIEIGRDYALSEIGRCPSDDDVGTTRADKEAYRTGVLRHDVSYMERALSGLRAYVKKGKHQK